MTRSAWLLPFGLSACVAGGERGPSWASDDPARPMMVAAESEADARLFAAAVRQCGFERVRRLERDRLWWIVLPDLPVAALVEDGRFACALRWSFAHPEVRLFLLGNEVSQ